MLLIFAFIAIITLPLVGMTRSRAALTNEKRTRALRPQLKLSNWRSFPEKFDAYFRDNFGFREEIIHWHSVLTVKGLRESPVREVIIGGHHRLFFAGYESGVDIRDFSGQYPLLDSDLDKYLSHQLQRKQEYAALGARYLIVLAPNKQSVYPEDVPARFGRHAPGLFDSVMAKLASHPELDVLDLRPVLNPHRSESIYHNTDTHWNTNGAFLGASAVVERIRPWFPLIAPLSRSDYDVSTSRKGDGDLSRMLAMPDDFSDIEWSYRRHGDAKRQLVSEYVHRVYEQPGGRPPRVLMLGDSFGFELTKLLADVFGRLHYFYSVKAGYDRELIDTEKPDLVVLVLVERFLPRLADQ